MIQDTNNVDYDHRSPNEPLSTVPVLSWSMTLWINSFMDHVKEDDSAILRALFIFAIGLYMVSLLTLGKVSVTHQWLFTNLTVFQPTSESIRALQQRSIEDNDQTANRNTSQSRDRNFNRQININNVNNLSDNRHISQERRHHNTIPSSNRMLEDQLSILEFTKVKIQNGMITLQQYRRSRRLRSRENHNNPPGSRTTPGSNVNTDEEAFVLWKYLETSVIQCLACFAILLIRWISHVRYCQSYVQLISLNEVSTGDNTRARDSYHDEWDYAESNRARWWLMLSILVAIRTWFYMSYLASMTHKGFLRIRFTPLSYTTGIVMTCCVWWYVGAKGDDTGDGHNRTTIDGALDEFSSRLLLLARLIGWKIGTNRSEVTIFWSVIRRCIRIAVTIFCGCFGFVVADPIYSLQHAMIYRLYIGSGNDIHINQKNIRYNASRWTHAQSKRVFVMETLWKLMVFTALIIPIGNVYFVLQYGWYDINDDGGGFPKLGSKRLIAHTTYVLLICVLVRRFQQDYLLSALPSVVLSLKEDLCELVGVSSNPFRTEDSVEDDRIDIHHIITYPFALRIETILRHGSKLACVPLMLTILFTANHISDFQRGPSIFPSAYGGPWLSRDMVQTWHQDRILSQISSFIVPLTNNSDAFVSSIFENGTKHESNICPAKQEANFFEKFFHPFSNKQQCSGASNTTKEAFDLISAAADPVPNTLLSGLRKLQKLSHESLKDNHIRACLTSLCDDSNKEEKHTIKKAKEKVDVTLRELREVYNAMMHHPLITAETVYTFSRFLEMIVCLYWTIVLLPHCIQTHPSMIKLRIAFLKLSESALHVNPQDAAD